ncbi:MAG: glycerate kinase type-2 family protein [Halapricum sp.]
MIRNRDSLASTPARDLALSCIEAGIEAAQPARVVAEQVAVEDGTLRVGDGRYDLAAYDEVVLLGGGKAADVVARALEDVLDDRIDRGLVVTTDPVETDAVEVVEGAHPVPDERAQEGAREIMQRAREHGERTLLLVAITGGGSALLPLPAGDLRLADLQAITETLVESGAAIEEINAVRKHLSAIKGGALAQAAAPASVVGLIFSDVVGDDPATIASGPTAPDETTYEDALAVLDHYDVDASGPVVAHLEAGVAGEYAETPADDLPHVDNHVLANAWTALSAAEAVTADAGYESVVLSSRIRGEATEAALSQVAIAEECLATGNPVEPPAVLLSGGEVTVTVLGNGDGGPNLEFALRAGIDLPDGVVCASVDTDGSDGATDTAGAIVDSETVDDPMAARRALVENDAASVLGDRDALIETGPTGTNVNDLRVLVID